MTATDGPIQWIPEQPHDRAAHQECETYNIHRWALMASGIVRCLRCGFRRDQETDDQIVARQVPTRYVLSRWLSRKLRRCSRQ